MSELLKKYESLDQSKLNEGTIKILNRVKTITADFTADDAKNNKIAEDVLNEVMKKNPNAVKIVKRTPKAKTAPKKTHKATHTNKGTHTTSSTAKTSNNIMSVTKEIQKAGESWKDAMERAKAVIKERKEKVVQKQKTELEKLYALVKTKKELIGFSKSDIERDAVRTAKRTGVRVVTKEGTTSNGYGTFPNKLGRKYWETRDRHADRLAPNYPKDTPLLAKGGNVNPRYFLVKMLNKEAENEVDKLLEKECSEYGFYLVGWVGYRVYKFDSLDIDEFNKMVGNHKNYTKKINFEELYLKLKSLSEKNKNIIVWKTSSNSWKEKYAESFANGGMMDNMSIHNSTDFFNTPVYAKGGSTQGYDDKEDERLAMKYGKIANKDLDSTHSRRDDARFEERGKMANGGSVNMNKHIWEGWTVGSFIEELEPQFNQIMRGSSWQKPFKTKDEVKEWCMDNQPYYKKNIPDVVNYFWAKAQNKDNYADGGMFEEPIGMMREVKGKTVNVPVTDEISQSEINRFVDYVYEAYESYEQDGVYEFTKPQVRKAVKKYLAQLQFEHTWGGGDSLDRERVYEFLINPNLEEIKNPRFLDGGMNNLTIQNVSFADGGSVSNLIRMYNFLKDDLVQLEEAIKSGDFEEVNRFFSYWLGSSGHLSSLKTMNNQRMYMFLQEDLFKLRLAVENNDTEEVERFFSYWLGSSGHLVSIIGSDIVPLVQNETAKIWEKNNPTLTAGVPPENFEKNWRKTQDEAIEKLKNEGKIPEDLKFEDIGFMTKNFEKGGIFYKEGSNKYGLGNTEIFVQEENDMYCVYDNVYNDKSENWEIKKLADFDTMDEAKEFAIEHSKKEYANGGSLPFMTDPNFGNFQNTGAFANGGSIGDLTEQEFLKKYFGASVFTENPSQYFEIKKLSSSDDAKVSAFVKELKADGFTVKKRAYSDFTSVMGVKKKSSFADGGSMNHGKNYRNDFVYAKEFFDNNGMGVDYVENGVFDSELFKNKMLKRLENRNARPESMIKLWSRNLGINPSKYIDGEIIEDVEFAKDSTERAKKLFEVHKSSFELGGAFMTTDLAGHSGGGTGGLNADMPLSGVSGTYYTGLVGETGAMSSGELFAVGGAVGDNVLGLKKGDIYKIIDEQHTASYDIFTFIDYVEKSNKIALKSLPFPPNPKKKSDFVYVLDISSDGIKVLNDEEIGQVITRKYKNFVENNYELGGAMAQNQQVINDASQSYVNYYLGEGASQGIYKDGGSIPNNYAGRTPEDVWDNWSSEQKIHFMQDHKYNIFGDRQISAKDREKFIITKFQDLSRDLRIIVEDHISEGQYASGGSLGKALYVEYSSYFTSNKYDEEKIMSVLKSIGAKNIRLENDRGWFNQPEVVVFNGDKNKAQDALNEAFDTDYIRVSEKDWRTKKMADGGFTPDVSDGTQFMSGVYANGGSVGDDFEEVIDLGAEQYYTRPFGQVETDSKGEVELLVVATIRDLEDYMSEDELPEDGNFELNITLVPTKEFISEEMLESANDEDSSISDDSVVNLVNYAGGLNYNPQSRMYFESQQDALDYLMSKELKDKINTDAMIAGFVMDRQYNRAGQDNWGYLDYLMGVSDRFFAKGGALNKDNVKVGDVLMSTTGVKVKVTEFDPLFGGRVRAIRLDKYGNGKESQFISLSKFTNKVEVKKTKKQLREEYLENVADETSEVWDKIGASSGGQIREDQKLLKAFADGTEEVMQKMGIKKGSFDRADYDYYTDINAHLFNDFLVFNGYYNANMTKSEKEWRLKAFDEDIKQYGKSKYVPNPDVITVKGKTSSSSKPKKYIDHDDIESVTLNVNTNFITFAGKDFLNGANLMEKGGDLSKIATYFPIRDIVKVTLKNGDTVKPLNGYWLKKGSEPIGKKNTSTSPKTPTKGKVVSKIFTSKDLAKDGSPIRITAPAIGGGSSIDLTLLYDSKNLIFDVYKDGRKKDKIAEKEVLINLNNGIYVFTDNLIPTKGKVTSPNYPNVNFNHKVMIMGREVYLTLTKSYVVSGDGTRQYDFMDIDGNELVGYGRSVKEALADVELSQNNPIYYSKSTPPKIDETKAHFKMDISGGGKFEVFVDSNFVNQSQNNLPNSELKHYGYGDFYLQTPDGNIEFIRTDEEKEGFVGRTHKMKGSDELVLKLVNAMKEKGRFESTQTFANGGGFANDPFYKAFMEKRDKLYAQLKSRVVRAVGIDEAMEFFDYEHSSIAPYKFIERAVQSNLIALDEINKELVDSAIEETRDIDNDEDLEEIGSSDFTYYLQHVLDNAGFKVGFVNDRLQRLNEDGSVKEIENNFADGGFMNDVYADGGGVDDEMHKLAKSIVRGTDYKIGLYLPYRTDFYLKDKKGRFGIGSYLVLQDEDNKNEWTVAERKYDKLLGGYYEDKKSGITQKQAYELVKELINSKYSEELKNYGIDSFADGGSVETEIHQLKRKLIQQAKSKGISENFGQKEVCMLEDKYPMNYSVGQFDEWVQNFDLNSYADGGMFDDNDGFMKADNNNNYRYPEMEVYVETLDEPIDLTNNVSSRTNEVVIKPLDEKIDLNDDNRVRARMGFEPKNRTPEKMMMVNPRMIVNNLPTPMSNTHKND